MIRVSILGGGNVSFQLGKVMQEKEGVELVQIYNRSELSWHFESIKCEKIHDLERLKDADVYIICIKDGEIGEFSSKLGKLKGVVTHTSGSVPIDVLDKKNRRGIFYPLQSLSKDKEVSFDEIPICVEGENEEDDRLLEELGRMLSQKVYRVDSLQRKYLHVSAVILNNFTNHLWYLSESLCKEKGVPFEVLLPLFEETYMKAKDMGYFLAQTGPGRRRDFKIIKEHEMLLEDVENEELSEIYKHVTNSILKTYGQKKL